MMTKNTIIMVNFKITKQFETSLALSDIWIERQNQPVITLQRRETLGGELLGIS